MIRLSALVLENPAGSSEEVWFSFIHYVSQITHNIKSSEHFKVTNIVEWSSNLHCDYAFYCILAKH